MAFDFVGFDITILFNFFVFPLMDTNPFRVAKVEIVSRANSMNEKTTPEEISSEVVWSSLKISFFETVCLSNSKYEKTTPEEISAEIVLSSLQISFYVIDA
jgi:hypothetical protein